MAMLPFCGYNMADYWTHWLKIGRSLKTPPAIFRVNWFRKDDNGKFIWPGFGENMRVLKWIIDRVQGRAEAAESPFGFMPRHQDINWRGLDFRSDTYDRLMTIDRDKGLGEAESQKELFASFADRLPPEMEAQRRALLARLDDAPAIWRVGQ